jgi:uncharacterized protein (TIGR02145 family)
MKTKIIISLLFLFMLSCNNYYYMEETINEQGLVTDIDGNTYKTVKIGEQWWMAENLKTTRNVDGSIITTCRFYAWDSVNYHHLGRLYNGEVITEGKLCPEGWRIPAKGDVDALLDFLGDNAGGKLKAAGTLEKGLSYWLSPNVGATNESGFSALPAGKMITNQYKYYGRQALFWICTPNPDFDENQENSNAMYLHELRLVNSLDYAQIYQVVDNWTWMSYYSVRCIKN